MAIGTYNGWSGAERLATIPVQKAAMASGKLGCPRRCSICKVDRDDPSRPRISLHDENYADPLRAYAICGRCHTLLHKRFSQPEPWLKLVAKHATEGSWFARLSLDPACLVRPFGETYPSGLPAPDPSDFEEN